jgi:predicted dehydrogenase
MAGRSNGGQQRGKIRYAVVGLGYFAQMSILPAFAHAGKNSELAALISGDKTKLKKLGAKYGVEFGQAGRPTHLQLGIYDAGERQK